MQSWYRPTCRKVPRRLRDGSNRCRAIPTTSPVREAAHKLVRVGAAARLLYARADGGVVKVDPPPAFARARRGQGVADVLLDGETEEERLLVRP